MNDNKIHRIGVDWGSTSFRAYLFDQDANLIDSHSSNSGIKTVDSAQFEQTLFNLIGPWLTDNSVVLFSGMITSKLGWVETPYLPLPAKLDRLLTHAS